MCTLDSLIPTVSSWRARERSAQNVTVACQPPTCVIVSSAGIFSIFQEYFPVVTKEIKDVRDVDCLTERERELQ